MRVTYIVGRKWVSFQRQHRGGGRLRVKVAVDDLSLLKRTCVALDVPFEKVQAKRKRRDSFARSLSQKGTIVTLFVGGKRKKGSPHSIIYTIIVHIGLGTIFGGNA